MDTEARKVSSTDAINSLDRTLQEINALCRLLYLYLPTTQTDAFALPTESFAIILQIVCDKVQHAHEITAQLLPSDSISRL